MMNPPLTLNYAYYVLIQEENQRVVSRTVSSCLDEQTAAVMMPNGGRGNFNCYKRDLQCTRCGNNGHKVDRYWKKFGVAEDVKK